MNYFFVAVNRNLHMVYKIRIISFNGKYLQGIYIVRKLRIAIINLRLDLRLPVLGPTVTNTEQSILAVLF